MFAMPARTLSPFVATDRALLSPHTTRAPPSSRRHSDHDHHDRRSSSGAHHDRHVLYDSSTASRYNPFTPANAVAAADYGHAALRVAPLPLELWASRNARGSAYPLAPSHLVQPSSSLSSSSSSSSSSPPPLGWLPHPPGSMSMSMSMSRFPPPSQMPQPPPLVHKVWIIDCKACGTFLTNRGMKAVLLLRPSVPLYSTDALPINCSAHSTLMTDEDIPSKSPSSPLSPLSPSSPTSPSQASPTSPTSATPATRTCDCLTQTLHCHTCGTGVGYMIVLPCARCTSAVSATHRSTNGHRFVFYSCAIRAGERHYVGGERGVMEVDVPPVPAVYAYPHGYGHGNAHGHVQGYGHAQGQSPFAYTVPPGHTQTQTYAPTPATPPRLPPTTRSRRTHTHTHAHAHNHTHARAPSTPRSRRSTVSSSASSSSDSNSSPPPLVPLSPSDYVIDIHSNNNATAEPQPQPQPEPEMEPQYERIRPGDVLYWHNLVRSGEIPAVREDVRARGPGSGAGGVGVKREEGDVEVRMGLKEEHREQERVELREKVIEQRPRTRKIVAGR